MVTACKNSAEKKDTKMSVTTGEDGTKPGERKQESTSYPEGEKIYRQYCATCHQANGSGVPNLNPPLHKTDYVTGDKTRLIAIVLNGSDSGLEVNGQTYANVMPPHGFLDDRQVAQVLSYIRTSFGNTAGPVAKEEVRAVRDSK
ncbi:cytochrome c [Sinomicrobium pectinilyticum]|uniref:Cytochrome c n=2 Tax=Sinomicrobium pectinilyticum TaxID=1084421 RepID=A0A3N0DJ65_SINP1|nr:cytochrome c [Sinomicrobium pectinilyticum]